MNTQDTMDRFPEFAAHRAARINQLSAADAIELMAAFYREVRADDCTLDADGDMLLFQWGLADWGDRGSLAYDITRQLIPQPASAAEEPHRFSGQLSLTLKFPPSAELEEIVAGNRWCYHPREVADVLAVIAGCEATAAVQERVPVVTALRYGDAE